MKAKLFFLVLIFSINSGAISGVYDIIVAENGNSFIAAQLEGNGTVNIPLPLDVQSMRVENALYLQAENGIDVLLADDIAFIAYTTSILTSKNGEQWNFEIEFPNLDFISATVSLPKNAIVTETSPKGIIKNLENSVDIYFEIKNFEKNKISIDYKFFEVPIETIVTTTLLKTTISTTTIEEKKIEEKTDIVFISMLLFITILILIFSYLSYKKFKKKDTPLKKSENREDIVLSKGKRNVMKTLSGNEIKIINVLLEYNGKMLRNELEKISGIPKSSLSVAINNLERKNILQVDKSEWTHEVELTEWFKAL